MNETKNPQDSAELLLELFFQPFVAGVGLPHQGVVDSYNHTHNAVSLKCRQINLVYMISNASNVIIKDYDFFTKIHWLASVDLLVSYNQ